jgi:hypothetical protein
VGCHFVQITSKRPARASGAVLSPASRPFSTQISSSSEQIGLQFRETGVMLEQDGPAMVPGEGQMGNFGVYYLQSRFWRRNARADASGHHGEMVFGLRPDVAQKTP